MEGKDPLDIAISYAHFECVQILIEAGHTILKKHVIAAQENGKVVIYNFLRQKLEEWAKNEGFQVSYITRESFYDSI